MSRLTNALHDTSLIMLAQLDIISNGNKTDNAKKRSVLDVWNSLLSPANQKVLALDTYGREVFHAYRSMLNNHMAQHLTYEEFMLFCCAILTHMNNTKEGDWNERNS